MATAIGVRANIHLGGADRVLPEWIRSGGGGVVAERGVVAEIVRARFAVGGGVVADFYSVSCSNRP